MNRTTYIFLGAVIALMSFTMAATTGWNMVKREDIETATKQINAFYKEKSTFSVIVTHQTFKGHHATVAHDESKGFLKRKGNLYHSFMLGVHSFQDEAAAFTVDTVSKTIIVADKKSVDASKDVKLESLVARENAVAYKRSEASGHVAYRVDYSKNHPVEATEMHVNADNSIKEIVLYMHNELPLSAEENAPRAKAKAKIVYSHYNLSPTFGANEFSHKTFFTFKDKKTIKTEKYSSYKLIDNRIARNQKND
ncbi:MAG TPA: hypothetical protein VD905_00685 [Flavobacteriales bacterium]|nr:hypothetical protein [Flavobacteriales bacterium]